jgi:tRNA nucleotidyltransferase/poly(A) polymerase
MTDNAAYLDALTILQRLRAAGHQALFAGGCVRDLLMGQTPQDYDVATSAEPRQIRSLFKNTQAVGAAFGVILVREGASVVEVATFRKDLAYTDGRHPTGVSFTTAEEDARRRDFTINGLFLDPVENRIIDHVGGQADLAARQLRAIGNADERFAEDHLRMLRAVRFASRLGFAIETKTALAIKAHADELIRISPERIAEELRKMLALPTRDNAYLLLRDFGFISILLRQLPEKLVSRPDETSNLFLALHSYSSIAFGLALAAIVIDFRMHASGNYDLCHWISPNEIKRTVNAMRQTLKISNEESAEIAGSMSFVQLLSQTPPTIAQLKRFLNQPHAPQAMQLMTACASIGQHTDRIESVLTSLKQWQETEYAPPPLVTGDDLTAAGASPGPKFKAALDAAYDQQLEGHLTTKEQALALALHYVR